MRSFEIDEAPARVVFGAGTVVRVGHELGRLGGKRALVLSTPGRARLAARVVDVLGDAAAGTFDGATMHTPVEVTERALAEVSAVDADSVVSVGGGSTTGLGKAIAVRTGLQHLVIPTTYAGSEVTPVLGETAGGEKLTRSAAGGPAGLVVYDVELTTTLPWQVTVTSAVNATAHAVEALYAPDRAAKTDDFASVAIAQIAVGLNRLTEDLDSLEARDDLMFGAWLAGRCLGTVGMGLHHKLCHTLGGSFGLPHAPTHTVVLPYVMSFNQQAASAAMNSVAGALHVADAPAGLQSLIRDWDGPTSLADLGFSPADIPEAAELATARPYPNPRQVRRDDVADLLTRATDGTPITDRR